MSKIPLKYHINVLFYTKYTHPTLICRGTDGRTDARRDGHTENIYSIFRDKLLLLGEHGQKNDLAALTFNPASRSLLRTAPSFSKWSSRVPLVMTSRSSIYALTYSRASIRFIISAWKISAEPAYPIGNLKYEYSPHGNMMVNISTALGSNLMV